MNSRCVSGKAGAVYLFLTPMSIAISHQSKKQFEKLLPELLEVYRSAYEELPEYAYQGETDIRQYLAWLYEDDPQGFFVAHDDGRLAAFGSVHGSWRDRQGNLLAEVHELCVRKEYQGKGIGTAFLRLALDYARSLGRDKVGLWVGERNNRAAALYERMGFTPVSKWGIWQRMTLSLPKVEESGQNSGQVL